MGIFRYFFWHFQTYPDSVTYLNQPQQVDGFDVVGLDLNAIFHPVCQSYYFDKKLSVKVHKNDKGCYDAICKEIESIVSMTPPKEELILAIDGVAGLSKMHQQRQRRFRSAKEKTDQDRVIFDSNQISTGTEWLFKLSEHITQHFKKKRPYRVTILDQSSMGEGEHKLIRYMEPMQKKRICIYSPDADLIMLSIGLNKKNTFILRPNIYSHIKCSHFLVNIDVFKKQVVEMVDPKHVYPEREQQIVDDFVFLLYFMGNDFLPHSPSFEIKNKGIDKILEIYSSIFQDGIILVRSRPHYAIHTKGFQRIVEALAENELETIKKKHAKFRGFPDPLLDKYASTLDQTFDAYRQAYYTKHFKGISIEDVCRDYVVGLLFVGTYYYQGMPDWLYCYPYYHGPFFQELTAYSKKIQSEWIHVPFDMHEPLDPLVQLLCVLPPESKRWLPECVHKFYDMSSPIYDLYPSEFKVDLDGVQNEYEGIVMLPKMDLDRVKSAFTSVKHLLTASEVKRNQHH
jgi:5'-3' exonuclease